MGFTLKIEGDENLFYDENIIQVAQMSLTSPMDSRARSTKDAITVNLVGKLHGDSGDSSSETLKLFQWAQIPAEDEKAYRVATIRVIGAGQCFRQIKLSKAFVIDYHERYSTEAGVGDFSLTIRQKADLVDEVEVEGGLPLDGDQDAPPAEETGASPAAPGGNALDKMGQAIVKAAVETVINRADRSGTAAVVMRNLNDDSSEK